MKKQQTIKKLTFNTETLRQISGREETDSGGVVVVKPSTPFTCLASCGLKCI